MRSRGKATETAGDVGGALPGCSASFPRTIWMLWLRGWEHAPELAQRCRRSREYHNPGWTIRALDVDSYPGYMDISNLSPSPGIDFAPAGLSDIIRINLLKTYGGVWVDADCFCRRPLDRWL